MSRKIICIGLWTLAVSASGAVGLNAPEESSPKAQVSVGQTVPPPPLPPSKAPVDFFRELLSMTPDQRQKTLEKWPAENKKVITAKIEEYEALAPDQRELRLRVTELRYYLLPLLPAPAEGREKSLARVPSDLRPLIEQRLRGWDQLSTEQQKEFLELRQAAEASSSTQQQALTNLSATQRQALEAAVAKWKGLGEDRRQELTRRFEEYFDLNPQERAKTLRAFSQLEQLQMESTLQAFSKLDPSRRARCVSALDKLASLTPREREEFLRNAARWEALSPAERKAWRRLVFSMTLRPTPLMPPPPQPPSPQKTIRGPTVATNQ